MYYGDNNNFRTKYGIHTHNSQHVKIFSILKHLVCIIASCVGSILNSLGLFSHRAARAQSSGLFQQEIVPVTTKVVDDDGKERTVTVSKDDGIRVGTTLAGLGKLRPAFKPDGSTTAGESSAVTSRRTDSSQQI